MITSVTRGDPDPAAKPNAEDDLILGEMRQRYTTWTQTDHEFLKNSDEELEFAAGDHWYDHDLGKDVRKELQGHGRSAISIDLLNPSIELVVNPMRINKPAATFLPVGEGANDKTALIRQGLYRNINRESRGEVARETAYDFAVRVGRGYYQILIDDEPGVTLDKCIRIQRIDDLGCVMIDQTGIEADYSDAEWAGIWDDLSHREYRAQYGDDVDVTGVGIPEDERDPWFKKDSVRRMVYFRRLWFEMTVAKLPPGVLNPKTQQPMRFVKLADVPKGIQPIAIGKKRDYKIQRFEAAGNKILHRMDWPGRWIPLIVMVGRELFRGRKKKKIHSGMVRPAMDVTRLHNFAESRLIDEVALSPLPHMMSANGQLTPSQEKIVNDINVHPWSVIVYEPKTRADGSYLPPPQWISPSPNVSAIVEAAGHAKDNLQRVLNTYSPQLGQMQGDQSGNAIREVKDAGDVSHAAFPDNASRALLHEARIINDLMDYVYSDERAITITQPDETTKQVLINKKYVDPDTGEEIHHLFGADAKYGVAMGTEHAYPTQMAEAADKLLDLLDKIPEIGQRAADIVVQAINLPGTISDKLRDRLRPADFDDKSPLPPAAQAKLAQAQQMIQHLTQALNETSQIIHEKRLELGSAERQTIIKVVGQLIAADFKYGSEEAQLQYKSALEVLSARAQQLQASPETGNPEPAPQPGQPPAGAPPPAAPVNGAPPPASPQPGAPPPGAPQ